MKNTKKKGKEDNLKRRLAPYSKMDGDQLLEVFCSDSELRKEFGSDCIETTLCAFLNFITFIRQNYENSPIQQDDVWRSLLDISHESIVQEFKRLRMAGKSPAKCKEIRSGKAGGKKIAEKPAETRGKDEGNIEVMRDQVFICYSHKDKRWLEDLETHLKPYVRNSPITAWSDKQIATGSKWLKEIEAALASTKVAALLVTPNFLASDFIHENELGPLLKKAEKGNVTIIWIPVRACSYKETPLKDYQAAIDPEKPLANMKAERDKSWVKICEEIKKAICA